jgi:hypothetical protein
MASVVIRSPAIDAAFCRAARTNLGRVNDALGHEVHVFAVLGIEAERVLILFQDLADDERRLPGNLSQPRLGDRAYSPHQLDRQIVKEI